MCLHQSEPATLSNFLIPVQDRVRMHINKPVRNRPHKVVLRLKCDSSRKAMTYSKSSANRRGCSKVHVYPYTRSQTHSVVRSLDPGNKLFLFSPKLYPCLFSSNSRINVYRLIMSPMDPQAHSPHGPSSPAAEHRSCTHAQEKR